MLTMDEGPKREREREGSNAVTKVVYCNPWKYKQKIDLNYILFDR